MKFMKLKLLPGSTRLWKKMSKGIYNNINRVLLVSFGTKKEQQKIIDHTIENKDRYKKIIESS